MAPRKPRLNVTRATAWALAALLAVACGSVPAKGQQSPRDELCARSVHQTFKPMKSATMPTDPLLTLILTTADATTLRAALKSTELDSLRGTTNTTLLAFAASVGNLNAVKVLIDQGAKVTPRNSRGESALDAAILNGQAAATCLLMRHGAALPPAADRSYLLPAAALSENFTAANALVKLLIASGFDIGALMNGDTALHIAVEIGNDILVRTLLAAHADPAQKNARGETAFTLAQRSGNRDVIRTLESARVQRGRS
jgi:ankyrin repeat protein